MNQHRNKQILKAYNESEMMTRQFLCSFYENYLATLAVMTTFHDKIQMKFPLKLGSHFNQVSY